MSTRCVINFGFDKVPYAKVYRHSDGYPNGEYGVFANLRKFFECVKEQTKDTRFSDPSYLAAKFVVWQSGMKGLDFLGVGVILENPSDIEYEYFVDCSKNIEGYPSVRLKK